MKNKVTLYLMGYKGLKVLEALEEKYTAGFIHEVISNTDKQVEYDYFQEIKMFCKNKKITFKIKDEVNTSQTIYSFSIAWRWLIPIHKEKTLIIFHDSLLPRYRGFAPLVNALINKEKKIGVTALIASEFFDEGKIIDQSVLKINYPVKINDVITAVTNNYVELILKIAEKIISGKKIKSIAQDETKASYSIWRDEEDYLINWNNTAEDIQRFINAVGYPYKGAKTFIEKECVRILEAEIYKDIKLELRHPGKIIFVKNNCPVVICGSGMLLIKKIISDKDHKNMLPIHKFRTRFKNHSE